MLTIYRIYRVHNNIEICGMSRGVTFVCSYIIVSICVCCGLFPGCVLMNRPECVEWIHVVSSALEAVRIKINNYSIGRGSLKYYY